MFYSQFILAKKGPLGTIWIAAHLERKLRKNQVADTDIGVSVDSIIFPEVPIALRLSSHLLLGVVRIYNRKVNYLFDDCSEALLKIKQAFRSTAVDLPPEQSKAPYHSITLPETFDLDDFELPENDILHGNYVDHHISSREQITLQDSMEGVSYSTSKFGLDERFGDGDASGLDLDEELFLHKIGSADHTDKSAEPQATFGSIITVRQDVNYEDNDVSLENKVDRADVFTDLMDYADAPCTPGLVEEPNLSNVQEVSACDDHLESEYHLTESTLRDNSKNIVYEDKQEARWCSHDDTNWDATHQVPLQENGYQSGALEVKHTKPQGESTFIEVGVELVSFDESSSVRKASSELDDQIIKASDANDRIDILNEAVDEDPPQCRVVDEPCDDHQSPNKIRSEKNACEISVLTSTCHQVSESVSIKDKPSLGVELPGNLGSASNNEKSCLDTQTQAYQEPTDSSVLKPDVHEKMASSETPFLRPCNSNMDRPGVTNSGCSMLADADVPSDVTALTTSGRETVIIAGKASCITDNSEENLKGNCVQEQASCKDVDSSSRQPDGQVSNKTSQERLVENLNNFEESQMPAAEKLRSVPDGCADLCGLDEVLPKDFEGLDEGDAGSKTLTGKKRSFTGSTMTEQSLNSAESSRLIRLKRTAESIPDDDDLLSSILVGRRSSVMNVKPAPPFSEVTSIKRNRSAPRSGPPKRKVPMDDIMVLHGDTIRQQLINTDDIRRVRKKAPCTRPEISLIQKQVLEDEIFRGAIPNGMSIELATLFSQVSDMSGIRICENDAIGASVDVVTESRLPSQNNENDVSLEIVAETNIASYSYKNDTFLETAVVQHSSSQISENVVIPYIERDKGYTGPNMANCEQWLVSDIETAVPCEKSLLSDNGLEEVYVSQDQIEVAQVGETKVSQQELVMDVAGVETNGKFFNAVDAAVVAQLESITHTNRNDDTAYRLQALLNENCEKNSSFNDDEPNVLIEQKDDAPSVELDPAMMDLDNGQVITGDEIKEKNDLFNEVSPGRDELNYLGPGNDTEFLNVDDDELDDLADDYMPDGGETRVTENSGWSSRTRAVSKYLQMMFIKEAEFGKKPLSMDNLLIGKSRKEASRLFFEALVLKTRDYIHVEQHNPADDITIKPRSRLMKSEF